MQNKLLARLADKLNAFTRDLKKVGRVGKNMYDASKRAVESLAGEITKKPEQLQPEKLKQAQGLAGVLTALRKATYLLFSLLLVVIVLAEMSHYLPANSLPATIGFYGIGFLGVIYCLFKIRDYVRGTI